MLPSVSQTVLLSAISQTGENDIYIYIYIYNLSFHSIIISNLIITLYVVYLFVSNQRTLALTSRTFGLRPKTPRMIRRLCPRRWLEQSPRAVLPAPPSSGRCCGTAINSAATSIQAYRRIHSFPVVASRSDTTLDEQLTYLYVPPCV